MMSPKLSTTCDVSSHKYVFFDVEGFKFYVLTKGLPSFDYVIGFFSKVNLYSSFRSSLVLILPCAARQEKISYDDYNLACIMTFPPYQKQGYGTLLIEFSTSLSFLRFLSLTYALRKMNRL
jgi:histone acetyltransferase MYST1